MTDNGSACVNMHIFFADKRKEARRRINARKKDIERGLGSADMSEMAEDEALLESEPGDKPEPPRPFDEEKVKSDVSSFLKFITSKYPGLANKYFSFSWNFERKSAAGHRVKRS